jgi:hypothetical protein
MEHEPVDFFQELKVLVTDYLAARLKLMKYEIYEKTAKIAASMFSAFVIVLLVVLVLLFFSISLGFYLGALFDSNGAGFLAVTGLYVIVLVPFIFFRKKWIEKIIVNRVLDQLTEKEEEEL